MNIRRGLLRLWIVVSIAWISIIGLVYSSLGSRTDSDRLLLELGLIPPATILVLGAALGWALTGFRRIDR
jgi:hypothetical protein